MFDDTPELYQVSPNDVQYNISEDFLAMFLSGSGDVTGFTQSVDHNLVDPQLSTSGCELEDFAGFTAGNIAILQRGGCLFSTKAINAENSGAAGVIIFNQGTENNFDLFLGTLGSAQVDIPVLSTSYEIGLELANEAEMVRMIVNATSSVETTFNVIAETRTGDPNNVVMVGAHLDSVLDGPGINDNGSGAAAVLETAIQMANVSPVNKLRFAFWGAEETGLVGSDYYVFNLDDNELNSISLYLNFDMIASPNFVYFIYDGSLESPGSIPIQETFESFYVDVKGLYFELVDLRGISDHASFSAVNIPVGGIFSGSFMEKNLEQFERFGGRPRRPFDPCFHQDCDTIDNVSLEALGVNADAIAYATLFYAMSFGVSTMARLQRPPLSKAERMSAIEKFEYHGEFLQK